MRTHVCVCVHVDASYSHTLFSHFFKLFICLVWWNIPNRCFHTPLLISLFIHIFTSGFYQTLHRMRKHIYTILFVCCLPQYTRDTRDTWIAVTSFAHHFCIYEWQIWKIFSPYAQRNSYSDDFLKFIYYNN